MIFIPILLAGFFLVALVSFMRQQMPDKNQALTVSDKSEVKRYAELSDLYQIPDNIASELYSLANEIEKNRHGLTIVRHGYIIDDTGLKSIKEG